MIEQLDQRPLDGIPVPYANLPRNKPIGDYIAMAKARGFCVVQYRQHVYLVRIH